MSGHRMTLHTAVLAATLAVTTSTLAGCGSSGPAGAGGRELNVWVYQDASTTVQRALVKRFNRTSAVKVKLTEVPGESYQDKMRTAMGTPNAPDVFFNWGGGSISDFVHRGMLLDLGPTMRKDPALRKAFIPSILKAGAVDGKNYGIPMRGMQPVILFYNKKVFRQAGVRPPTSWHDLLTLTDTFKAKGVTPFSLAGAGTDAWTELMWLEYLLDRDGGPKVFQRIEDGHPSGWSDPSVLKAATQARDLVHRGAFGRNFRSVNYTADGASTLFAKGRAAMFLMGSWEYANQKANQPAFARSDLGWTTFPAIPGGSGDPRDVVGNPTNYWSVNARTKHRTTALAFLKFTARQEYAESLVANGDVPTTTGAESLLDRHENPTYARFQYDLVQRAPSFTLSWDQALPAKQSTPLITNVQKLFNGQLSPAGFVHALRTM